MKHADLKLMKSKHVTDYPADKQYLAKWRDDVFGPLSVLYAVRELVEATDTAVIKFAIGGHPADEDGGKITKIVTIGLSDDPALNCKLRYCGENDNPMGAGSSGVHCYTLDAAENAMVILSGFGPGNIYRLAV